MEEPESFTPNAAQRQAIEHVEGPLYLTAGPGSGKTSVLLWRALNLMVFHDVKPVEIYLSTFTEKAALQLREGLQSRLGLVTKITRVPYDLSPMYVGTVHSLCHRILTERRFCPERHRARPPQLLDDLGQYFHLYRNRNWTGLLESCNGQGDVDDVSKLQGIINQLFDSRSRSVSKHNAVANCQSFFNRLSEERISPERALALLESGDGQFKAYCGERGIDQELLRGLIQMYAHYLDSLQIRENVALTDFSLVQQAAYEALCGLEGAGSQFKHVIIDEYQDTNTIQERIFFKLAKGHGNICVVGDDDQALYRFRGATVENFVEFPERCSRYLDQKPTRIPLSINYRSRKQIVESYTDFMEECDWSRGDGSPGHYRVVGKDLRAHRGGDHVTVVASTHTKPVAVCAEIADLVRRLIDGGKVKNANQIAFLFPSLKWRGQMNTQVQRMKDALESEGLRVYAPRAGTFLQVDEAVDMLGCFLQVFGKPRQGHAHPGFRDWLKAAFDRGKELVDADPGMASFMRVRQGELDTVLADYQTLLRVLERNRWELDTPYDKDVMKRPLLQARGLSEKARRSLSSVHLDNRARRLAELGQAMPVSDVVWRATSLDWTVLDLFYRFCGFGHFKAMFDLAQRGEDEGPICNLGLLSQYLSRFMDEYGISLLTARLQEDGLFKRIFFMSYLYALYRRGESEYEDAEDPFPKGRIPFLTIHQAKGLEFPVVVLGNPRRREHVQAVEVLVRPLMDREPGEPLDRMSEFDNMRMFYVALSRAKNLLVIAHFGGRGNYASPCFKPLLEEMPCIPELDVEALDEAELKEKLLPRTYSFTGDYMAYQRCPRQYMIFDKYGFAPSQTRTMFFGSLVHRTLDDLHNELIRRRGGAS